MFSQESINELEASVKRMEARAAGLPSEQRSPRTTVRVGLENRDKVQLALSGMLGVKEARQSGVRPFRGIREAYEYCTGDVDLSQVSKGGLWKVSEAIATTDFPNLLLDSMFKKLIQDYAEYGMGGLEQVITEGPALSDYRTRNRVRMGYFGDLPTVAEAGPFTELTKPTDEKVTYTPLKKGGVLTISEETIRADDTDKINQFPARLARAARHTLKSYITNYFTSNLTYTGDSVAWFNASHNNLIATPLSVDNLIAAEVTQMKQTERDSGNRLPFRISWLMVPVDLAPLAWQINNAELYNPGPAINVPNPFYRRFGDPGTGANAPKGVIVNELLTDTNDWYWGVDVSEVPAFEMAYMDGISNPQILLANLPTQGTQFTNDQVQYKAKFGFGGAILDFRGVGKAVVP